MDKRQIAALLTLRELGIEQKLDNFDRRLSVQKSLYLAQAASVNLGYFFSWYIRGPYSPAVSKDLFPAIEELGENTATLDQWRLDPESQKRLKRLAPLLRTPAGSLSVPDWLELLASVHFAVSKWALQDSLQIAEALQSRNKPYDASQVQTAMKSLKEAGLL
jgi:hypothetical protein